MADLITFNNPEIFLGMVLLIIIIVLIGFVVGSHGIKYNIKLIRYLRKNKPSRWKEINSTEFSLNAFKLKRIHYIFNDLDMEDKTIAPCKLKLRKTLKVTFVSLILIVLIVISGVLLSRLGF